MSQPPQNIQVIWSRIENILRQHVPKTALTLAQPATEQEITDLASAISVELPRDFVESLRVHNGQNDPTLCYSFCTEGVFASTTQIAETWEMLTDLDDGFRQQEEDWDTHGHGEWWNRTGFPIPLATEIACV